MDMVTEDDVQRTIECVARVIGITKDRLLSRARCSELVRGRYMVMYLLRQMGCGISEMERHLGWHHATCVYGVRVIDEERTLYPDVRAILNKVIDLMEEARHENNNSISIADGCDSRGGVSYRVLPGNA